MFKIQENSTRESSKGHGDFLVSLANPFPMWFWGWVSVLRLGAFWGLAFGVYRFKFAFMAVDFRVD